MVIIDLHPSGLYKCGCKPLKAVKTIVWIFKKEIIINEWCPQRKNDFSGRFFLSFQERWMIFFRLINIRAASKWMKCFHENVCKPWQASILFNTHINTDSESNFNTHDIIHNVMLHDIFLIINIIPENEKVFILKFYDIEPCIVL